MQAIAWLPAKTNALLETTVAALEKAFGKKLVAALLVGTAMNPSRSDRGRAPEILAVVSTGEGLDLTDVARHLREPMLAGARVRIVTSRELERSLDVFALEIADWKARHKVLSGKDPLDDLEIEPTHLRFAIEMELRGLVRRMRNRMLAGLATDLGRDNPSEALSAGYDRLVVSAYHTLQLLGEKVPSEERDIVERIAKRGRFDVEGFLVSLQKLRKGEERVDPIDAFESLLAFTEHLTELVDGLEVKP